jgi:hypothetical protein
VINVEGLRSPKAIAFIFNKSNPRNSRLNTKTYSTVRTSAQVSTGFLETESCTETGLNVSLIENLGDMKWIK